ncbi:hypothetical protein FOA52_005149 [Chlamydomonas sp. UWO 241]|nr:hypothetical protein FOA52_005149 [Chlamydomonas sp. UWO 241]
MTEGVGAPSILERLRNKRELAVTFVVVSLLVFLTLTNVRHHEPKDDAKKQQAWGGDGGVVNDGQPWLPTRPQIVLLGDSLTEYSGGQGGWGTSLAAAYGRKADVVNRGFAGYNTKWALPLVDDIFADCTSANTALVTFFFGANDAALAPPDGTPTSHAQHVPLPQFRANMRAMVAGLQKRGLRRIVLMTPPPVYEPGRVAAAAARAASEPGAQQWPLDRSNATTGVYAAAVGELGKELGLPVVELWEGMQADEGWGDALFTDGLHFTPAGNAHVYGALMAAVASAYPDVAPSLLPLHFPHWSAFQETAGGAGGLQVGAKAARAT